LRDVKDAHREQLDMGLRRDANVQISTWRPLDKVRVSASSLERYEDCPFVFASTRLFKLVDEPYLDLDLDHRSRGLFLHAILEAILRLPDLKWDLSTEELQELVDSVREQTGIPMGEEGLWSAVRTQHIRLAEQFLQMEKSWRERFPKTQTVGLETEFQCHWDLERAMPVKETTEVFFSGRLDRVDQDSQGRYALIDYKASSQNLRNWGSWIGAQDLQMPLYAMLLELGLTSLPAGPVESSNFYVVKERDRRKGYHVKDDSAELYSTNDKHRNWITSEQKQELFNTLRELVQGTLKRILAGDFAPAPKQLRICDSCKWRTLCRVPHLS
jgi:ATP-dependent helicase/DNAse subunit B